MTENDFVVKKPITQKMVTIYFVCAFFISVLLIYYYEYRYLPSQEVPILKASNALRKVKPEGYDGMLVPNTDKLVYNTIGKNERDTGYKSAQIMPSPEEPIRINKHRSDVEGYDKIEDIITDIMSLQSDAKEEGYSNIQENSIVKSKILKIAPIAKHDVNSNSTKRDDGKKGRYRLQLASMHSSMEAHYIWERLKVSYSKHLAHLPHVVEKHVVKHKGTFYRLLVGEFSSFNIAKSLCKKITSQYGCVIVKY